MLALKKYYPYMMSIFVCLVLSINSIIYINNQYKTSKEMRYNYYNNNCLKNDNGVAIDYCIQLKKEFIENDKSNTTNVYDTFISLMEEKRINVVFFLGAVILISFPAIYYFHHRTKNGNLKNILVRENYETFIKKEYFKSLKASLIIPLTLIILVIAAIFISNNFEFGACSLDIYCANNIIYQVSPCFYLFMLILNSWLQSIGFVNLAYIADRKCRNLFLTIIRTYILFLITVLSTSFITVIVKFITNNQNTPDFSINNMWNLTSNDKYFMIPTIINILFIVVTFIIFRYMYKDKEKVLIDNE